jgi:hypothetical protein
MIELETVLKKHNLRTTSYQKKGKAVIIDSNKGKLVLKPKSDKSIYSYLDARSFSYYPETIISDDNYEITPYLENVDMPDDQKMIDLISLVSLLHNKTTYYKNVDYDEYKKNYEELKGNISYLMNYYNDFMSIIESKVFPSPAELLFARNCSIVFASLSYCEKQLDEWYLLVKDKTKRRYAVLHNNLSLDHFIRNKNAYLISWNSSSIGLPVYDLYKLYKKYSLDFDFEMILKKYEQNSPLSEEEKKFFFILISMPDKLIWENSIYQNCKKVRRLIDNLYVAERLVLPQNME